MRVNRTKTFPRSDRSSSAEIVMEATLAIYGALRGHAGEDERSNRLFLHAVGRAICVATDPAPWGGRAEDAGADAVQAIAAGVYAGSILETRVRAEREEIMRVQEQERQKRVVVTFKRPKVANVSPHRSTGGGGRGPNEAA
jgi:hypothetical protein